jgi:SPP1 family predicted phage head-tail adaptor
MMAGKLDQRITLKSATGTCDAMGQPVITWTTVATVWAQVEPLTGRELEASQGTSSEVSIKIIMRYYSGLLPSWRITHGTKTYQILAVLNLCSGKKDLKLLCKEIPATAV